MNERQRILEMVHEGRLSVDEAEKLLRALEERPREPERDRRVLRIRISGHRGNTVNVAVPLGLSETILRFLPKDFRLKVNEQEVEVGRVLAEIRESGATGKIVDVTSHRGDHIEITVE